MIPVLTESIQVIGQYLDMRRQYNSVLPVPGAPVQEIHFGLLNFTDAEKKILEAQQKFHADQVRSTKYPIEWIHVGFFQQSPQNLIYYYQFKRVIDKKPPLGWSNYPDEPPVLG